MSSHPFLSPAWISAAREIHGEFVGQLDVPDETVRMNVTVFGAPFADTDVRGHVDTTTGSTVPNEGHIDDPDVSVRVPYEVARQLLVDQEYEALMIAFMSGEIEVEGDITRIMLLQDFEPTPEQQALGEQVAERLRAITA